MHIMINGICRSVKYGKACEKERLPFLQKLRERSPIVGIRVGMTTPEALETDDIKPAMMQISGAAVFSVIIFDNSAVIALIPPLRLTTLISIPIPEIKRIVGHAIPLIASF